LSTSTLNNLADLSAGQQADSITGIAESQRSSCLFEREDWTLFRSVATLGQKAGVRVELIPRLVAKELVDNSLDAVGDCRVGLLDENGFWVEDDGDGIPGDDEDIARLFSIRRPLVSSKVLRRPTRGALGNGLRVVAGAVLASGGSLTVSTHGRILRLVPQDDTGDTQANHGGVFLGRGTRIEVRLGHPLPVDDNTLDWARTAILLASGGKAYQGRSSAHWYDADSFFELLQAAKSQTAHKLIATLEGCTEPRAGKICSPFKKRAAADLSRAEASRLLAEAQAQSRPVPPKRLGGIGRDGLPCDGYACTESFLTISSARGGPRARLPFVAEVWASRDDEPSIDLAVNRTPAPVELEAYHDKTELTVFGCELAHGMSVGRKPVSVQLHITTPYMPITSDGKTPNLLPFKDIVVDLIELAAKRCRKATIGSESAPVTQKGAILSCLDDGVAHAGGGNHRFGQRQLYYSVRELVKKRFPGIKEPTMDYFCDVITEYENEIGRDIAGMYRDTRGTLYHPHTSEEIALGTLNVEEYRRPAWTFNKILYCEKEGFFPILKDVRWPERNDCALMTSKGFASRAARDVIDMLGDTDEEIWFYCIHDADAYGTMIMQALQEATKARPARRVKVVNLGLEPREALDMGLQPEPVERKRGRVAPVAEYAKEHAEWLQSNRVELNAMTTPQFLAWLDRKFADQVGKVVPPDEVLVDRLEQETRRELEDRITARVLRRARIGDRVAKALAERLPAIRNQVVTIGDDVNRALHRRPSEPWSELIRRRARRIARSLIESQNLGPPDTS
jgi:hypothetical protein